MSGPDASGLNDPIGPAGPTDPADPIGSSDRSDPPDAFSVCPACARRTWLLGRLAGHLDAVRVRIDELLTLGDGDLIAAVGGRERAELRDEHARVDPTDLARVRTQAGLTAVCRCAPGYPAALRDLDAPPAVLHVIGPRQRIGEFLAGGAVAIVGARRATAYGRQVAHRLAVDLSTAGVTVVSGLALGVDGAAHEGALAAGGRTIAVLAGAAERPYPPSHRRLHARIGERGTVISELPPGTPARRWMFPARNRLIAALSAMTVVVQAGERSGALITARWASRCGRPCGAVPGAVDAPLSAGPHGLLRDGATLVTGARDVLEAMGGDRAPALAEHRRAELDPALDALLQALAAGERGIAAFTRAGLDADGGLVALASLELAGLVRRGAGGRYVVAG